MAERCGEEYEARWEDYFAVSGAQVAGKPVVDSGESEESWLARRFAVAEAQLLGCWAIGGRYWEVVFQTEGYVNALQLHNFQCAGWDAAAHGFTCAEWYKEFNARWNELPKEITGGFCAPANCTIAHMRAAVFPKFLAKTLHMTFDLPIPETSDLATAELSHWSEFKLDFVVGGVNSCGTTSLYQNLATHPDIDFTLPGDNKEDGFFYRHNRVLPYAADVAEFNSIWHFRGQRPPKLRGMDHPELFRTPRIREAISRLRRLKVIVIVCDPLSRFEKTFWLYYHCHPGANLWASPKGDDGQPRCWDSVSIALEDPWFLDRWQFGETLRKTQAIFGDRLMVVHQDELRADPAATYGRLAAFLGAPPFERGARFWRANSLRGQRTGLCQNVTLLRALQERMDSEYRAVEEVLKQNGRPVPESLRLRRTRCDRHEDLAGPP